MGERMSKIITPAQIKELYNISKPATPVPLHKWKLDEEVAGAVLDSGSSPVDGTNNGALINQDGFRGKCYEFDGSSSYVDTGDIRLTTGGSISVWIYINEITTHPRIIDKSTSATGANGYVLYINSSTDALGFNIDANATITYGPTLQVNKWYHICATFDGATTRLLYVNGEEATVSGGTADAAPADVAATMRIADRAGTADRPFDGLIKDVQLYDIVLNARQVKDIYRGLE